jgi:hypothetical protein
VPKGRPAALAYVSAFVEEAKASGLVCRRLDSVGLTNEQVAPAGGHEALVIPKNRPRNVITPEGR